MNSIVLFVTYDSNSDKVCLYLVGDDSTIIYLGQDSKLTLQVSKSELIKSVLHNKNPYISFSKLRMFENEKLTSFYEFIKTKYDKISENKLFFKVNMFNLLENIGSEYTPWNSLVRLKR